MRDIYNANEIIYLSLAVIESICYRKIILSKNLILLCQFQIVFLIKLTHCRKNRSPSSSVLNYGHSWIYGKFWRAEVHRVRVICKVYNSLQYFVDETIFYPCSRFLVICTKIWICLNIRSLLITIFIFYSSSRFLKIFLKMWICLNILSLFITIAIFLFQSQVSKNTP